MIQRLIQLPKKESFFLFGSRGTGKTTLLKSSLMSGKPEEHRSYLIDLLNEETYDRYLRQPQLLEAELLALRPRPSIVVIDEIQRLPRLLNTVHRMIEAGRWRFALTGSSARKLKKGAANLLAGRAFTLRLFPLTHLELGRSFDLDHALRWGTLPKLLELETDSEKQRYLRAYVLTYLKEEIAAEQFTRRLEPFRQFLEISAQMNGKIINYTAIARDSGVDTKTVQSYFQILEDTLVGFHLPAFHASVRKSQRRAPKFYWFDPGVRRALEDTLDLPSKPGTSHYGELFEHWVILEAHRLNEYFEKGYHLSYFQTYSGSEIDLVLSRGRRAPILVEIKSTDRVDENSVSTLGRMQEAFPDSRMIVLSRDPTAKTIGGVECLYWTDGLRELFNPSSEARTL
jgi:predicted AAA+ superfamily ATPase